VKIESMFYGAKWKEAALCVIAFDSFRAVWRPASIRGLFPCYPNFCPHYNHLNPHYSRSAPNGGIGMGKLLISSAASYFLGGKIHSGRVSKKLKMKHQKEQKALYQQYYNDVYKLTDQNTELQSMVERLKDALRETEAKHELEALTRDYDEFKQPDIDGDDRISRAEFNMYVKNYLSNYPGLKESDYPRFEGRLAWLQ
jgi:hypothetical protein